MVSPLNRYNTRVEIKIEFITNSKSIRTIFVIQFIKRKVLTLCGIFWSLVFPLMNLVHFAYNLLKKNSNTFNLFIVQDSFNSEELKRNNLNGATKVNEGLLEVFLKNKFEFHTIGIDKHFFRSIQKLFGNRSTRVKFFNCEKIILSVPGPTGYLGAYLSLICRKNVYFVAHNPEFLHRMEWSRNLNKIFPKVRYMARAINGLFADFLVCNFAFRLYFLGETELKVYWNKLLLLRNKSKLKYLPYIPPSRVIRKRSKNSNLIAAVGTYAKHIGESKASCEFNRSLTQIRNEIRSKSKKLACVGYGYDEKFCDVNFGFLTDEKFMDATHNFYGIIVSQNWGWGFKTKIADALFADQRVFLSTTLAGRYPSLLDALDPIEEWSKFVIQHISNRDSIKRQKCLDAMRIQRSMIIGELIS